MNRGAWWATVHRVPKSWTQLKHPSMHTGTRVWLKPHQSLAARWIVAGLAPNFSLRPCLIVRVSQRAAEAPVAGPQEAWQFHLPVGAEVTFREAPLFAPLPWCPAQLCSFASYRLEDLNLTGLNFPPAGNCGLQVKMRLTYIINTYKFSSTLKSDYLLKCCLAASSAPQSLHPYTLLCVHKHTLPLNTSVCMHTTSLQSCLTLCNPMHYSSPGSFILIFPASIAILFVLELSHKLHV